MLKERPILFSDAMVRAILAGTKTQTRRIVKDAPGNVVTSSVEVVSETYGGDAPARWFARWPHKFGNVRGLSCPYGAPGDRLWVKETWTPWADEMTRGYLRDTGTGPSGERPDPRTAWPALYRADYADGLSSLDVGGDNRWHPSIHMPRKVSRITLEVTGVRVERLQDISGDDARAEGIRAGGCDCETCFRTSTMCPATATDHVQTFAALWEAINAKRAPWASNPWVWVVSFRRVEAA